MKQNKWLLRLVSQVSQPLGKVTLTLATLLCSTIPAQAVSFNFTYDPGVSFEYKWAAETAALYWQDILRDDATINIHLDVASSSKLPQGVLGGAIPAFLNNASYSSFRTALTNDRRSSNDFTAVANLPGVSNYNYLEFVANGTYSNNTHWALGVANSTLNFNHAVIKSDITLTTANAKALGLINKHATSLDGTIVLNNLANTNYLWENLRTSTVSANEFDLTTVLIHEMGHILGFVSGVDAVNDTNSNQTSSNLGKYATPLNLFSRDGFFNTDGRLIYGGSSIFTIDGGKTNLGYWSTGADTDLALGYNQGGDGWQASHFKSTYTDAIMNPALSAGMRRNVTSREITFLDAIGWDTRNKTTSDSTLQNLAYNIALNKGNIDQTVSLNNMFNQSRWGGTTTTTTFNQTTELADFLAQQGFFQQGTFWSHLPAESASVPEPTTTAGLFALGLLGLAMHRQKKFN
ncbi:hypothetical protein NIES22_24860 [Calothrix brevissima NIES-22]|nr:hypothetical protein NIES22_24860 [Calothrix brevissima NIES-22]